MVILGEGQFMRQVEGRIWCIYVGALWATFNGLLQPTITNGFDQVPGIVIHHLPHATGKFIGSPSIAILPSGDYIASHDEFGPESTEYERAVTHVYRSHDRGDSWERIATIQGQFWSTLFYHNSAVYLLGTWSHHGNAIVRKSEDDGRTWTEPCDSTTGLLAEGQYHCSPQPVVIHDNKIWRAMEDAAGGEKWGERYRPLMMSASVDADLLNRDSWTFSNCLSGDKNWLDGNFRAWLEGNAVVDPEGVVVNILRVDVTSEVVGKAAIVRVSDEGRRVDFNPEKDFIDFPGGSKKFTIRHDPISNRYWSLSNWVKPEYVGQRGPASIRNTLALISSDDLRDWKVERVVIHDPNLEHGFQYADWLFDGSDIVAVVRTATEDGMGGPRNYHDANFMTFHRIQNFRETAGNVLP